MTELSFDQLTAPVTDLAEAGAAGLSDWRWLVPSTFQPVLLTILGDLFLQSPDGSIHFLDTAAGTLTAVGVSYEAWQHELESPDLIHRWFAPGFVAELLDSGATLNRGEVYSPTIPEIVGGGQSVENYSPSHWLAHLHVLGSVHQQVKNLPDGTPVTRVHVDRW